MGLFFNMQKPRKYNYKPLYYDERKENMRKRIERVENELNHTTEESRLYDFDFKGAFTNRADHLQKQKSESRNAAARFIRLLLILAVLLVVVWILSWVEFS